MIFKLFTTVGAVTAADTSGAGRLENAATRKRQRREERAARQRGESDASTSSSSDSSTALPSSSTSGTLAQVIRLGVAESNNIIRASQGTTNRLAALHLVMQFGSAEERVEAMDAIRTIARESE
jgi:hypothetical protein